MITRVIPADHPSRTPHHHPPGNHPGGFFRAQPSARPVILSNRMTGQRPPSHSLRIGRGRFRYPPQRQKTGVMIESTLPQPFEEKAKAILEQSKTQKLIGKITNFSRKGARQIQYLVLAAGVVTLNGQPIRMTFDKIAAIHWQPA